MRATPPPTSMATATPISKTSSTVSTTAHRRLTGPILKTTWIAATQRPTKRLFPVGAASYRDWTLLRLQGKHGIKPLPQLLMRMVFLLFFASTLFAAPPPPVLWYGRPAAKREEALPVGSCRLGAMVFGGTADE